ncbi:MAG: phosphonate ABC transporter, partial [Cyanobacteriota bacterium]
RRRAPSRVSRLSRSGVGQRGRELLLAVLALLPLLLLLGRALDIDPAALLQPHPLPPSPPPDWRNLAALPWPRLISNTVVLTLTAAALAVGGAPLLLLAMRPWWWGRTLVRLLWALGRLWPPPLTALLLLFVLQPGILCGALALAFHNLGILGRLLLEASEADGDATGRTPAEQALEASGSGARLALLYGRFSSVASSYLAYGAYRADVILRESVVVGLVGATGLGSQLLEALSSFAWDQIAALMLAYTSLTLLGEDLSDRIRQRLLARAAYPSLVAASALPDARPA